MPNSSGALTKTKPGIGEHHPAAIHPCVRPHFATNLRTRATLHDYHLEGMRSMRIAGELGPGLMRGRERWCHRLVLMGGEQMHYFSPRAEIDTRASSLTWA